MLQGIKRIQLLHLFDGGLDPVAAAGHECLLFRIYLLAPHCRQTSKPCFGQDCMKRRKIRGLQKPL